MTIRIYSSEETIFFYLLFDVALTQESQLTFISFSDV